MVDELFDPAIAGSVRIALVSEVAGVQAFGVARRHARNARDRHMWDALHELEMQTRAAIYEHLGDGVGRFARAERFADLAGSASGAALHVLPQPLQMQALVLGTKPFLRHFRKLNDHFADSQHASLFGYVLAHEQAIAELGKRGLAGEENALAPVEALLGTAPL